MKKSFSSKRKWLTELNTIPEVSIDISKSVLVKKFSYFLLSGEHRKCVTVPTLVAQLNRDFGNIIGNKSRTIGRLLILDLPDNTISNISTETDPFDADYAKSLKVGDDPKKDKLALETYARAYSIELNRRLSFDNMLAELLDNI